jgi:hypothetical protein
MQGHWTGEPVGPDVWVTCRELIPAGSVFAFLAEHREKLFPGDMFADLINLGLTHTNDTWALDLAPG